MAHPSDPTALLADPTLAGPTPSEEVPWLRRRENRLTLAVAGVAALLVTAMTLVALEPWARQVLTVEVIVVPFWTVLLLSVPLTALAGRQSLSLVRFGGAVVVDFDSAVLAFCVCIGAGAASAELIGDQAGQPTGNQVILAVGAWSALAWLLGVLVAQLAIRGSRPGVRAFNVALSAVAVVASMLVFVVLRWEATRSQQALVAEGVIGPYDLVCVLAAAAVFTAVDLTVSAASVAWSEDVPVREVLLDVNTLVTFSGAIGVICLGVFTALQLLRNAPALVLLAPVAVALMYATRVGTRATSEQQRTKILYDAAAGCQRAETGAQIVDVVVAAATTTLHATVELGRPPAAKEVGVLVGPPGSSLWLVARARANGQSFTARDRELLETLGALAGQALARVDATDRLRRVAEQDALTGLSSRTVLWRAGDAALLGPSGHPGAPGAEPAISSLIFCDVDEFKAVNDTHGHRAGDAVLTTVAARLQRAVRPGDVVARIGGDEFAVLLVGADETALGEVRDRIAAALAEPHQLGGIPWSVGVSLGTATWRPPTGLGELVGGSPTDLLLELADRDMYERKRRRGVRA